jgi:hypothetical protein
VAEIARYYDTQLKPGTLSKHFSRNITPNVKLIQDADSRRSRERRQPNGCRFGLGCQRRRRRQKELRLYRCLFALLCFFILLLSYLLMVYLELQKCFGSDATVGGIKFQFATRVKADVELIKEARAKGIDCKDIKLSWADHVSIGGKGTQICFAFCFAF